MIYCIQGFRSKLGQKKHTFTRQNSSSDDLRRRLELLVKHGVDIENNVLEHYKQYDGPDLSEQFWIHVLLEEFYCGNKNGLVNFLESHLASETIEKAKVPDKF